MEKCIFSIDVEDWFHFLNLPTAPKISEWDRLPSSVEKNFLKTLELFTVSEIKVTCFFLGWIARKYPHLVQQAARMGHEIASHGMVHRLVYDMSAAEFLADAKGSKDILENIVGHKILGYRAAGFSVTDKTPWAFEKLLEAGYAYDSSIFPTKWTNKVTHGGGMLTNHYGPHMLSIAKQEIAEFPVSVKNVFKQPLCFFGGAYLRIFPYFMIKRAALDVLKEGRPTCFYVHPREIDPSHPRLAMNPILRLPAYMNLKTTEKKIREIIRDFEFETFQAYLESKAPQMQRVYL